MLSRAHSLLSFYIGFLGASLITYFLLPKILKWKISWNFKLNHRLSQQLLGTGCYFEE